MYLKPLLLLFLILGMIGCASAGVNITSYTPLDPTPVVYDSINFTANFSEDGFFEWLVDGSVVQNGTADNTTYTFSLSLIDDYNVTIRTADAQHSWALRGYEYGMQVVTAYTPASSTPSATSGTVVEFTANLSEPGFYEWLVNDTVVQNGTVTWGNLSTSYNYTASSTGDFNITIRPENDQQEWILSIEPNDFVTISPTDTTPSGTVNTSETFTVTLENPANVYWYRNGSLNQTNTSVTECSYFVNSSTSGTFNITAISADDTQTWILTISDASGILGFINVPAVAVTVVIVAGGAIGASFIGQWYRKRRK